MTKDAVKLTPASAKAIKPGEVLKCHMVKGLLLRSFPTKIVWYLDYRTKAGVHRCPKLGLYPSLQIEDARAAARTILTRVAAGEDPGAETAADRTAVTVWEMMQRYLTEWADKRKKASSRDGDASQIKRYLNPKTGFGALKVKNVEITDVDDILDDILHRRLAIQKRKGGASTDGKAPYAANRFRSLLSKAFNLAETRWKYRPQNTNPVRGTNRSTERRRRRFATTDELEYLGQIMDLYALSHPRGVAALWTLFLTGARVNEIAAAKVGEWQGDKIVKKSHKTDAHIGDKEIPLPPQAIEILKRLKLHLLDKNERLFVSRDEWLLETLWNKIRADCYCEDLQLRDVRRTFASVALSKGATLDQIGKLFGHTSTQTTAGYAWLLEDARIRTAHDTAAKMAEIMGLQSKESA